jgi:hypothetical protein
MRRRALALAITAATLIPIVGVAVAPPAASASFTVTNNNDAGAGSLRQALLDASANGQADTVVIQQGIGTITLASPLTFAENHSLELEGNDATIDADGQPAALDQTGGGGFTVQNLTITGIGGSRAGEAGAVIAQGGPLTVKNCTITGNDIHSTNGEAAGIVSEGGALVVDNCTITDNDLYSEQGEAGAVVSEGGATTVTDSQINGNNVSTDDGDAGAILALSDLQVAAALVAGNTVTSGEDAAAVFASGGLTIEDSTIRDNAVSALGVDSEDLAGGAYARNMAVEGSQVVCNSATTEQADTAGGLHSSNDLALVSTTVQGNTASATSATADLEQQVLVFRDFTQVDSTVSDDDSICQEPPPPPPPPPSPPPSPPPEPPVLGPEGPGGPPGPATGPGTEAPRGTTAVVPAGPARAVAGQPPFTG